MTALYPIYPICYKLYTDMYNIDAGIIPMHAYILVYVLLLNPPYIHTYIVM